MATLKDQPWYCNGSVISGWLGCADYLPTSQDQVAMMRDNFGKQIDPSLANNAVSDFQDWLDTTNHDGTMEQLKKEDSKANSLIELTGMDWKALLIGVGVVGVVLATLGQSGPRRYGR